MTISLLSRLILGIGGLMLLAAATSWSAPPDECPREGKGLMGCWSHSLQHDPHSLEFMGIYVRPKGKAPQAPPQEFNMNVRPHLRDGDCYNPQQNLMTRVPLKSMPCPDGYYRYYQLR